MKMNMHFHDMSEKSYSDRYLRGINRTPRVEHLRKVYFRAMPEVCIERPKLITEYCRDHSLFGQENISVLQKAKMYRYALESRAAIVRHGQAYESSGPGNEMSRFEFDDRSLFAGSTTSKFKGVPLYPEFLALSIWPELWSISTRLKNPYWLSEKDATELNTKIFPPWMEENIMERTRARCKVNGTDPPEMSLLQHIIFFLASKTNCISHTIPDFSRAVGLGLEKMIDEAERKRDGAPNLSQRDFYLAVREVLEGIIAYSDNLAAKAEELAQEESVLARKQELTEIAEIYHHVPRLPARSFREGLTTVWVCWIAIHLENPNIGLSLGRLDQVLYDLYAQDINGTLSLEKAVELICCLWLKIGDHVPMIPDAGEQLFGGTGSNQAITIGGVRGNSKEKTEDAVNELTYVILKATELMMLRDPNLNARYYPGVNQGEYLSSLCEANIKTRATPALHNDQAVIKSLMAQGDSLEQARDYGIVGCVEPVSNGRSYTASASILLNLPSILEMTLYNGRHRHIGMDRLVSIETGDPADTEEPPFRTFEQFKEAFQRQLQWMVETTTRLNNELGKTHQRIYPTPILSASFEGPMEKGRDLIKGGAVINASGVAIIGLADVADSLNAIEQVIYQDKRASFPELIDALNRNFDGHEALWRWLKKAPKYGNETQMAEANVRWLMEKLSTAFQAKQTYRSGTYRVGYWTMTNHAGFGRLMKALPNGRKAHENFAGGITPVSGAAPILAAALNSVAALPATYISNGMALNLKYTPEQDKNTMLKNFSATVEGYFDGHGGQRDGGMEIQFNVTDHEEFLNAVYHPEKPEYQKLLVRVSGYTAYFKDLNRQMQKEIIDRTEYLLSNGQMESYEPFSLTSEQKPIDLSWLNSIPGHELMADKLLEALLHGMKIYLSLSEDYRQNIKDFKGRYLFETSDESVTASVIFDSGDMEVHSGPIPHPDVRVAFKDEMALMELLFSQNQDILNLLMENKVETEGNVNYIYRFGYLARDLQNRLTGKPHS